MTELGPIVPFESESLASSTYWSCTLTLGFSNQLRIVFAHLFTAAATNLCGGCTFDGPGLTLCSKGFPSLRGTCGAIGGSLPIGHLRIGNGPAFIELELDFVLRLRPPISDFAEIIECSRKSRFEECLETTKKITSAENLSRARDNEIAPFAYRNGDNFSSRPFRSSPLESSFGRMMGVTKLYLEKSKTSTLSRISWKSGVKGQGVYIAQLARSGCQSHAMR